MDKHDMGKKQCVISVLMSVYNETIEELNQAIESIVSQTYTDFEYIIVNDHPGNEAYDDALSKWSTIDERIVILKNHENIGLAQSMNKALRHANGRYIARMDADDIAAGDRFEKQIVFLQANKYDVIFTNFTRIGDDGELLDKGEPCCFINDLQNLNESIVFDNVVHHPTVMMTKQSIIEVGGYRNFPCAQDQDLWIRMLEAGKRFFFLDEILLKYRIRSKSISQEKSFQQYLTLRYILQLTYERSKYGKDNFSEEQYDKFISKHTTEKGKETYMHAKKELAAAQEARDKNKTVFYYVLRLKAFFLSKELRDGYLFRLKYKTNILRYINSIE